MIYPPFFEKAIRFLLFVYIKIHHQQMDKYSAVLRLFQVLFDVSRIFYDTGKNFLD